MIRYTLGLDLGTTSIGWALIQLDSNGDPVGFLDLADKNGSLMDSIPGLGVRIFPAGVEGEGKNEKPRNHERRNARGQRRTLRRRRGRKKALREALREAGLLNENDEPADFNAALAARAVGLDKQIELHDFALALINLAQKRGFKSNRKDIREDDEEGKVVEGIESFQDLMKEKNARTVGELLYKVRREEEAKDPEKQTGSGARIHNVKGNYEWSFTRAMCEDEFDLLWKAQSAFYPDVLTRELRGNIREIIFHQIPFELSKRKKRKIIGRCSLEPHRPRCPLSSRLAQEFRILQQVNDLTVRSSTVEDRPLTSDERAVLTAALNEKEKLKFDPIRKKLKLDPESRFNFEYEGRDDLTGNGIDAKLANIFKRPKGSPHKNWAGFDEAEKEKLWRAVCEDDADTLREKALSQWALDEEDAARLCKVRPPTDFLRYSEAALMRILPHLRKGLNLWDSIQAAGYKDQWEPVDKLPTPDRKGGFEITNPIVRSAMYEIRKLVNQIIAECGKPEAIVVELVRDMKASAQGKDAIIKRQNANRKARLAAEKAIEEQGHEPTGELISKYRLWEEMQGKCPYCDNIIERAELFQETATEVDHILPYSHSLDNSFDNKVVCHTKCNREKGERTPKDWLGGNEERWLIAVNQIAHLGGRNGTNLRKFNRFFMSADEIPEELERMLRDTAYLEKSVCKFLRRLYPKAEAKRVRTTKGGITAQLRRRWGLDRFLNPDNEPDKNREDHRHHALDAAVVAVTEQKLIQRITNHLKDHWESRHKVKLRTPQPWQGYWLDLRNALHTIKVSHRVQRKVKGALHKKTNYGQMKDGKFASREFLTKLTGAMIQKIPDPVIRGLIEQRCKENGVDPSKLDKNKAANIFAKPLPMRVGPGKPPRDITRVRIHEVIGQPLELPGRFVQSGSNHHMEIVEYTSGPKEGKWEGVVVTMFEAARRVRDGQPVIQHDHGQDMRFVMSLSINEAVILDVDGAPSLYRVQKMDVHGTIIFRPNTYAGQMSDRDKPPIIIRKSASTLECRKVCIDRLGRIRSAND